MAESVLETGRFQTGRRVPGGQTRHAESPLLLESVADRRHPCACDRDRDENGDAC